MESFDIKALFRHLTAIDQTRPIMRKSPVWRPSLIIPARPYGRDIMRENGRAKAPLSRFPRRRWWCAPSSARRTERESWCEPTRRRGRERNAISACSIRRRRRFLLRLKSRLFAFSGKKPSNRIFYRTRCLTKNLGRRIIKISRLRKGERFNREKKFRMGRRDGGVSDRGRLA